MKFKLDWLSVTIWGDEKLAFDLWKTFFSSKLGTLEDSGHGATGYKELWRGLLGVMKLKGSQGDYFGLEFSGEPLSVLEADDVFQFLSFLAQNDIRFKCSRIDFAFDNVPWTVKELYQKLLSGQFKSTANRSSIKYFEQPFQMDETGSPGCHGLYLGAASSARQICCYDSHGFVRLELRLREDWAEKIGTALAFEDSTSWIPLALGCLAQFMEVEADWWTQFMLADIGHRMTVYTASELRADRMEHWLEHQVSPSLAAMVEVNGESWLWDILQKGAHRQNKQVRGFVKSTKSERKK